MSFRCKACNAEIIWGVTAKNNKAIPLDVTVEQRAVQVGQQVGRWHTRPVVEIRGTYMPHHVTCPKAAEFRKQKEKPV